MVTDGFVGNIVLKTAEGLGKTILQILKRELTATPVRKFGALVAKGRFQHAQDTKWIPKPTAARALSA